MAKRAKRASRPNPRQDRNKPYAGKTSNIIEFDRSNQRTERRKPVEIVPRNVSQEHLLAAIENPHKYLVFAVGAAGTGKTMLATHSAIKALKAGKVKKIVISRPNVAVDDTDIGFLPGDIVAKMSPWMLAVLDVFYEHYSKGEVVAMIESGVLEMVPIAFIRGRTFKDSFIILDEAQNTTISSMLSALTRIGENSKMVITGDLKQSDRSKQNGLSDFVKRFAEHNPTSIEVVEFTGKDVQRHKVIKDVLNMYKDFDV